MVEYITSLERIAREYIVAHCWPNLLPTLRAIVAEYACDARGIEMLEKWANGPEKEVSDAIRQFTVIYTSNRPYTQKEIEIVNSYPPRLGNIAIKAYIIGPFDGVAVGACLHPEDIWCFICGKENKRISIIVESNTRRDGTCVKRIAKIRSQMRRAISKELKK